MPNTDGTGREGQGQRCRTPALRKDRRGGRGRGQHSPGGRRSGGSMGSGRRQGQGKKWQRNENQ